MTDVLNIFKSLEPNQVKIKSVSLNEPSFLKKFNRLDLNINSEYKNRLWFIFYYLENNDTTTIDINNNFEKFMNKKLEDFQKISNKKFNKSEISTSILNKSNDGFTSKIYISELFDITLFIYYSNNDLLLKFGNGLNSYLVCMKGDDAILYFNSNENTYSNKNESYIDVEDILNFKKLKIGELRSLAEKFSINIKKDNKFKLKKDLLDEIDNFIKIKIIN